MPVVDKAVLAEQELPDWLHSEKSGKLEGTKLVHAEVVPMFELVASVPEVATTEYRCLPAAQLKFVVKSVLL